MRTLPLPDGHTIPVIGVGTWRLEDADAADLVPRALELGYRHVDTAAVYENERGVGQGLRTAGLPRDQVFVTTKLWNDAHSDPATALARSLERLGLDYVDLYLIHWPVPTRGLFVQAWEGLIGLQQEGLARSIGVSNFEPDHLAALDAAPVRPAVNQVELHPSFRNRATEQASLDRGLVVEAWSPLGKARDLGHPAVTGVAAATGATPAQVVLAWHLAQGRVVFPKTAHRARLAENLAALDVTLTGAQVEALDSLDTGRRTGRDPYTFDGLVSTTRQARAT